MNKEIAAAIKKLAQELEMNVEPSPLAKFNTECMGAWHNEIKLVVRRDIDDIRNRYIEAWTAAKPGQYHVFVLPFGKVLLCPRAKIFTGEGCCLGHTEKS